MLAQNVENCLALGKTTYFCTTVYMFIADALTLYAVKLQFRTHTHTLVQQPFFRNYLGEPVPERENQSGLY